MRMTKTLELAISKVAALPEAAQERIAYELLERVDTLATLSAALNEGVTELDAGLGSPLDVEDLIRVARAEYVTR